MNSDLAAGASIGARPTKTDPPAGRRVRHRAGIAARIGIVGALLVLVLGACSAGPAASDDVATLVDPSATPAASPSASLDPEGAMDAFAQCMRAHGVDIQVSTVGDGGSTGATVNKSSAAPRTGAGTDQDKTKFDAANKACASLLPKGGLNGPNGQIDPEMEQKMLAFSACMREHGIDMPDPKFENGGATVDLGGPGGDGPQIDPNSQAFKDAEEACKSLMPEGKGGPGDGAGPVTQGSKP
ncbi:MAG TPA: hypothetical protein VE817_09735 [Candidatus Acidoferrum sp.]|nr:hypothetical protein [Candidatus Acidoferrum sp.]